MSIVAESASGGSDIAAALAEGVKTISEDQVITFTLYTRYVLPVDGYVFWIRQCDTQLQVEGSLHYITEQHQRVDETIAINSMIFTALEQVQEFNAISPGTMYIGEFEGIQFAFNQRSSYYEQSGLHHYMGNAVYPALSTQLLASTADIPTSMILSNSIPIWMSLTGDGGMYEVPTQFPQATYAVYPEYLVPDNIAPQYVAVEVEYTEALQAVPWLYNVTVGSTTTAFHNQLMKDKVKLYLYGFNHQQAMFYFDYVLNFIQIYGGKIMGLMNCPAVTDVPRIQSELGIRAQKKVIEFEVSYYQSATLETALQLILHTIPNFDVQYTFSGPGWKVPPSRLPSSEVI
jgi:hypothetical protein